MPTRRFRLAGLLLPLLVLALAGCGGGSDEADSADSGSGAEGGVEAGLPPDPLAQGEVAVYVNDEPVYQALIDRFVTNMNNQGAPPDPEVEGDTREERLRATARKVAVEQKLVVQAAREAGYTVTEEELELRMGQIIAGTGGIDGFRQALAAQGIDEASVRREVHDGMLIQKYFEATVNQDPEVSEEEIRAYYEANPEEFEGNPEVRARHILFTTTPGMDEIEETTIRARANELLSEIRAGADFAEMAREHSQGPSAPNGGDLGWFKPGAMVPPFDSVAFAMEPGDVAGPVKTRFGYHLIKVEERRTSEALGFEKAQNQIRFQLANQKVQERSKAVMDSLRAVADIRQP